MSGAPGPGPARCEDVPAIAGSLPHRAGYDSPGCGRWPGLLGLASRMRRPGTATGPGARAGGVTYWNGQAMHGTDVKDLDQTPEATASATVTAPANAAHLARLLRGRVYPPRPSGPAAP